MDVFMNAIFKGKALKITYPKYEDKSSIRKIHPYGIVVQRLAWLFKAEGQGDNGYSDFYNTIDTILMGRKTYEQILALQNGNFPY